MSRPSRAEHWHHTAWTYRGRALIHPTQAAALFLPIVVGALALRVVAAIICLLVCELTVLLVALMLRPSEGASTRASAWAPASAVHRSAQSCSLGWRITALGWSSDARIGVEDAVAHFAGNGATLRELAALRGEAPIDAEILRLGRQAPVVDATPDIRVEVARLPYLGEPSAGGLLVDEPVDQTCCAGRSARQYLELVHGGRVQPT